MPSFELPEPTEVTVTNVNTRRELHGEEAVRAIDISLSVTGDNTLLDRIKPGLRQHHYCNTAAEQQQAALPEVLAVLPNLRHPELPHSYHYQKGTKLRGYIFTQDYGLKEKHLELRDAVLSSLQYTLFEGGSVEIKGTIQYNGEELNDDVLYGQLAGLAAAGKIHVTLKAPPEPLLAKKGYRANKPDTPAASVQDDQSGTLDLDGEDEDGQQGAEPTPILKGSTVPPLPLSPETALAQSLGVSSTLQ